MFDHPKFECVIGLEIHAQLKSNTKMFSSDSTEFDAGDNQNISTVSLGMPGALPTPNRLAIELGIKMGLALGCQIRRTSVFARKNYFYPDLPKGYQISQYDQPLCENGKVEYLLDGELKSITIERAHLEEDAGKSNHYGDYTLLNYNRSGVALLEIVSGPDLRSPAEAAAYAKTVRQILRYLDVCDGNLEEGSMRCDCNVSIRFKGESKLGTKVEIKNINSFRFVEKALEFEFDRQVEMVERGEPIIQETRLWDPDKNKTFSMRLKESADDYRYFPDPDLLPLVIDEPWFESIKKNLPELPLARLSRFQTEYQLPAYDAAVLTAEKSLSDYFEKVVISCGNPKGASNWVMTELLRELNDSQLTIENCPIKAQDLGAMVKLIDSGDISGKMAKSVFLEMWKTPGVTPQQVINEKGLVQVNDESTLAKMIEQVITANPQAATDYRSGKTKLFGFFVGQVMKVSKGQANPEKVNELLKKLLES